MEHGHMGNDTLFVLLGAIMVLAMHAGFAFLEVGTVRKKNQVNALVKIIADFATSTIAYFFIGFAVAYGVDFFKGAETLSLNNGYELVKFFFLLTFAAAIPAIISGGIAERAKFRPQLAASFILVALIYPTFEGMTWNGQLGMQAWLSSTFGYEFHDFAGSVVVHAMGGWLALGAVMMLGARKGRYTKDGKISAHPPSSIPFLALGAWILTVGWFGFNVMSAQAIEGISGLVALNSLMAMAGGILAALIAGKNDPGFVHNGALAGLVAVCAGSDIMHPLGALVVAVVPNKPPLEGALVVADPNMPPLEALVVVEPNRPPVEALVAVDPNKPPLEGALVVVVIPNKPPLGALVVAALDPNMPPDGAPIG